ncbi:hypothetical protein NB636_04055 [Oxalobacter aliiformigenes]|uniref:hypothetical protein n=1 Tax=Oxalobacter aliiformigenes TaxID=2946593 RepID=UPI0022AEDA1C|nr:hypothetical protein [Oxalobacter aliiformigenes]MCZ4065556.1 hypothetical protein [Oxalobacter aliiformigenes]WAW00025.1 hypothetical protein NB636_04055 [Oxalobacter aliiformigenes]
MQRREFIASRENGDGGIMPDRHTGLLRYRKTDFHNKAQLVPVTECIAGTGGCSRRIRHDDVSTGFVASRFPETPRNNASGGQAGQPERAP